MIRSIPSTRLFNPAAAADIAASRGAEIVPWNLPHVHPLTALAGRTESLLLIEAPNSRYVGGVDGQTHRLPIPNSSKMR